MFFENHYIVYSNNCSINLSSYKLIMTKFINKYIENNTEKKTEILLNEALVYSKYYLYYKILNCTYDNSIMDIIFNYEHSQFI